METQPSEQDGVKKSPFDSMSRDDLIKKCKGLLGIAQKAKQAKNELSDENKALKEELQNYETQKHADKNCLKAMQEMVDALTQNKLSAATTINELQSKIAKLDSTIKTLSDESAGMSQLQIENESLKRQTKRLTDENDGLLKDFEVLENKFDDVSKISLEHQKGLLLLEKSSENLENENKRLMAEVEVATKNCTEFKKLAEAKENELKSYHIIQSELSKKPNVADAVVKKLESENEDLRARKLKSDERLKLFKTKIMEFSAKLKQLKVTRENLTEIVQEYSVTVPKWQMELSNVSKEMFERMLVYETRIAELEQQVQAEKQDGIVSDAQLKDSEIADLKLKLSSAGENLALYEANINELTENNSRLQQQLSNIDAIVAELKTLNEANRNEIEQLTSDKKQEKVEAENLKLSAENRIAQREQENKQLLEELEKGKVELFEMKSIVEESGSLKKETETLRGELVNQAELLDELKSKHDALRAKFDEQQLEVAKLENENKNLGAMIKEIKEKQQSDDQDVAAGHVQRIAELESQCKNLEVEIKNRSAELESFMQQSEKKNVQILELQQNNEALSDDNQKVTKENENIATQLREKCDEFSAVSKIIEELEEKNAKLLEQVEQSQNSESQCRTLEAENTNHAETLVKFQQQLDEHKHEIDELRTTNSQIQNENANLVKQLTETSTELQQVRQALAENDEIRDKHEALMAQMDHEKSQIIKLQSENDKLLAKADNSKEALAHLEQWEVEMKELRKLQSERDIEIESLRCKFEEVESLKERNIDLLQNLAISETKIYELEVQYNTATANCTENSNLLAKLQEKDDTIIALQTETASKDEAKEMQLKSLENELQATRKQIQLLTETFGQEKETLEKTLKDHEQEMKTSIAKIKSKDDALKSKEAEVQSYQAALNSAKSENKDLLSEMKEINQVFKERGGIISKQQSNIAEMETTLNELKAEVAKNKENVADVAGMQEELAKLKKLCDEKDRVIRDINEDARDRMNANMDNQSEVLSTSTISRAEESMRMREIEDSFEEKYIKLRVLAIKLKKKVAEQNAQIATLELEKKSYSESAASKNTASGSAKSEMDALRITAKDREDEISKLKHSLEQKETELKGHMEKAKVLKVDLEKSRVAAKKSNVLSLEMDAYEKSLNDVSQKLELKKVQNMELETTIETLNGTMKSLQEQIKLLEDSLEAEKVHSRELKQQIDIQQNKTKESEHFKVEINLKYEQLQREFDNLKLDMDESKLQFTETISEKDRLCSSLISEKEKLLRQIYALEDELEDLRKKYKIQEQEVENMKTEFASYKIRAQSVLRQNQSRDSSHEKELEEELQTLQTTIESLNSRNKSSVTEYDNLTKQLNELRNDKELVQKRCRELMQLLEDSRNQNESILDEAKKQNFEHQEIMKMQRIQIDTINTCYKQQIEETEEKYRKEIENLKEKIRKGPILASIQPLHHHHQQTHHHEAIPSHSEAFNSTTTTDEQKLQMILMEREDGEGSESTSNNAFLPRKISNTRNRHEIVPLDELLNNPIEDSVIEERPISPGVELKATKEMLNVQESRAKHLTALLSEAEQDLVRLTQLNEVLKEEVRRQQRSAEREEHIQNTEYIKNIIFKFLTLNNGDEKSHLVPVLNTILRLSPEETHKLQAVAKGGEGSKWLGKIPLWSNNN